MHDHHGGLGCRVQRHGDFRKKLPGGDRHDADGVLASDAGKSCGEEWRDQAGTINAQRAITWRCTDLDHSHTTSQRTRKRIEECFEWAKDGWAIGMKVEARGSKPWESPKPIPLGMLKKCTAPALHQASQGVRINWLDEVGVESGIHAARPVPFGAITGHRDEQQLLASCLANRPRQFQSIHARQSDVDKRRIQLRFSEHHPQP